MGWPTRQEWDTAQHRLRQLDDRGESITAEVSAVAAALGVAPRSVWRQLRRSPRPRPRLTLSETDIAAFADFCGNVSAVHRARAAAIAGAAMVAGVSIDTELAAGWAGAPPVTLRTLQRAFSAELTPVFVAGVTGGERARRSKLVYLQRPGTFRNQVWEGDHKNLPILVLPPRGNAVTPWVTMFIDDATRVITGWAIGVTPHAGTVLTSLHMGMIEDPVTGPAHGVPGLLRLDRGLEFAAASVQAATSALGTESQRLPGYQPNKKGKIERAFLSVDQLLLCTLPGYTGGARQVNGALAGPVDDRVRARGGYAQVAADGIDTTLPLGLETFARIFRDWVAFYNTEHVHSELRHQLRFRRAGPADGTAGMAPTQRGATGCCTTSASGTVRAVNEPPGAAKSVRQPGRAVLTEPADRVLASATSMNDLAERPADDVPIAVVLRAARLLHDDAAIMVDAASNAARQAGYTCDQIRDELGPALR